MADLAKGFRQYSFMVRVRADGSEIAQGESDAAPVLADEIKSNLESLGVAVGAIEVQEVEKPQP